MNGIVVLMYHAIHAGEAERLAIDEADRPYAISRTAFEAQLDCLAAARIPILHPAALQDPRRLPENGVLLTFDDGHGSNHAHALPALAARGLSAIFFVTTRFIGARPGFCTWEQLAEMSAAGMAVGSHGASHRFFDEMSDAESAAELRESRDAIAAHCGVPSTLSFPGGRHGRRDLRLASEAGYAAIFGSEFGCNDAARFGSGALLRRVPIRRGTDGAAFERLVRRDRATFARHAITGAVKGRLRSLLGNRVYHALYERLAR